MVLFKVLSIVVLMRRLKGHDTFMHGVTEIGNSAHTFSLLIPVAAAIDMNLACDLIVAATVGEWTSTLLKWLAQNVHTYYYYSQTWILGKKYTLFPFS